MASLKFKVIRFIFSRLFSRSYFHSLRTFLTSRQEAADRGNVYAMGNLVALYYERKLFTKASDLGFKVAQLEDPIHLAKQTGCLPVFIAKGFEKILKAAFLFWATARIEPPRCALFGQRPSGPK